ncbi:hypothetical protein DL96DRAFT_1703970 [Flagelloscypha sp. PMI_526]|nr:hypothetical protein DL96DRAFT_1703970 [Flagelloscypha sp. PMI_526]
MKLCSFVTGIPLVLFSTAALAKLVPGTYEIRSTYKKGEGFAGANITPSPLPPPDLPPVITDYTGNNVSLTWTVTAGPSGQANAFVFQNLDKSIAETSGDEVILRKNPISAQPFEWHIGEDTFGGSGYYTITALDGSGLSWILSTDPNDRFGYVLADFVATFPASSTILWEFIPVV